MSLVDFIYSLEYKISQGKFWCDGIYLETDDPIELTRIINSKKFLRIPILYGQSGQEPYIMDLYFGRKALSRNAKGLDLTTCLPDFTKELQYVHVDKEKKDIDDPIEIISFYSMGLTA